MPANEYFLRYFPEFDRNGAIWRYMSLDRFDKLLESSSLWFSASDRFDDAFEGSISDATRAVMPLSPNLTPQQIDDMRRARLWWRQWTQISCWQSSRSENSLMWQAYAPSGVAIQTTFAKLSSELPDSVHLSPVKYLDFSRQLVPEGNVITFLTKRHHFSAEQEVRAILIDAPAGPDGREDLTRCNSRGGVALQVDLSRLIDRVVVHPYASSSALAEVRDRINRHGRTLQLYPSSLTSDPVWL
jgi:plasmid stability protein